METSFFSGSENLYKYLVTTGILLMVLTVYYPLREKQEMEIFKLQLQNDANTLSHKINENHKVVKHIESLISHNGKSINSDSLLSEVKKIHFENQITQISVETKFAEVQIRQVYINLYRIVFWIFFPVGIILTTFGYVKWKRTKKYDDEILKLEKEKLQLEVDKLRRNP